MTNTIFVYKAKRRRNSLTYIPYKKFYNSLYEHIDIDTILEKIGTVNMTSIVCQGNLTGDFVRNALGFDEIEEYEDKSLRMRHFYSNRAKKGGSAIMDRTPFLFNDDVVMMKWEHDGVFYFGGYKL